MQLNAGRLSDPFQPEELLTACKRVLINHGAFDQCASIEPRRSERQRADLRIRFIDKSWTRSQAGQKVVESFSNLPFVAEATSRRSDIFITFKNDVLIDLEQRTAQATYKSVEPHNDFYGRHFHISFVQPNANKALHLGHLRNIFIGQALCCALESAGAEVRRRSVVADIGRRICEAMAGYLQAYQGEDPQSTRLAGDRFVELCSRAYQAGSGQTWPRSGAGPNAHEDESLGDTAETILKDLLQGENSQRELWRRMRAWVLIGHENTMRRLGTSLDDLDFESEGIYRAHQLVDRGLRCGLFKREQNGSVVHRSGRSEYSTMVLLNETGIPTECARILAVCHRVLEELDPEVEFLELLGDEWRPAQTVMGDLLSEFLPDSPKRSYGWLYYGLVTHEGQKIGSSRGQVLWIDDFLNDLIGSPVVADLHSASEGRVDHEVLADIIVRTTFLCAPIAQPLSISPERLLTERAGPGWTVALCWCRASAEARTVPSQPMARAGLLLSESFPSVLHKAVGARDPAILASYLLRLSNAFLTAPHPGPSARPALQRVLASLGFKVPSGGPGNRLSAHPVPNVGRTVVQV